MNTTRTLYLALWIVTLAVAQSTSAAEKIMVGQAQRGFTESRGVPNGNKPAENEIALERLIQEALTNSPEIARASRRVDAARAVVPQASTLPDPSARIGYKDLDQELSYGVRQEFPFPGKLRLRGEVASKEAEQSAQEAETVRRRVVARIKAAYYELYLTHRSIAIVDENRAILVDLEQTARARYGVGQAQQADVLRAQTEVSRSLTRIAILRQQKESLQAELNRLINRPPASPLGRPMAIRMTPLKATLDEVGADVERRSSMLTGQTKMVERGERALELARREYFPDFELDLGNARDLSMRRDGVEVMLSVKVPLYYATRQREGVREAQALRSAAENEFQATRQEVLFQLKDSYTRAQRAEQVIKLLSEAVLPQAGLTLRSAQAGYSVGAVDFLTVLNSLLTLQENRLEVEMETVEHEKALARLEELIGELP